MLARLGLVNTSSSTDLIRRKVQTYLDSLVGCAVAEVLNRVTAVSRDDVNLAKRILTADLGEVT